MNSLGGTSLKGGRSILSTALDTTDTTEEKKLHRALLWKTDRTLHD